MQDLTVHIPVLASVCILVKLNGGEFAHCSPVRKCMKRGDLRSNADGGFVLTCWLLRERRGVDVRAWLCWELCIT